MIKTLILIKYDICLLLMRHNFENRVQSVIPHVVAGFADIC